MLDAGVEPRADDGTASEGVGRAPLKRIWCDTVLVRISYVDKTIKDKQRIYMER